MISPMIFHPSYSGFLFNFEDLFVQEKQTVLLHNSSVGWGGGVTENWAVEMGAGTGTGQGDGMVMGA